MTSHDCVARVRWLLKQTLKTAAGQTEPNDSHGKPAKIAKIKPPKVGHGGTLDPAAIGVLPIAIGQATRLLQYLPGTKTYRGTVRFGLTTSTDDLDGHILTEEPAPHLNLEQIRSVLEQFKGKIEQFPPCYSAIQVEGKRLYDLARKNQIDQSEVPHREVEIYRLEVVEWRSGEFPELVLEISCGTGTYIRSIARDLGQILGTGATLAALTRTESAGLALETSLDLDTIATQLQSHSLTLLPPLQLLSHLPRLHLNPTQSQDWQQGKRLAWESVAPESADPQTPDLSNSPDSPSSVDLSPNTPVPDTPVPDSPFCITTGTGQFLGVGTYRMGAYGPCLQPKVVWGAELDA
ncbi:MAG: tRNA pseudouridine(55) synthase TruB [Prochlorothrix sp.]